jgi:hypothetical protein
MPCQKAVDDNEMSKTPELVLRLKLLYSKQTKKTFQIIYFCFLKLDFFNFEYFLETFSLN